MDIIVPYNLNLRLSPHREYGMFGWHNIPVINTQEEVAWLNPSVACGSADVDILKYPAPSIRSVIGEVCRTEGGSARRPACAAVKEAQVRCL